MFQALSNALSGLYAQKSAINTISHNIANANTEGYTRQRVNLGAVGGNVIPAWYSTTDGTGQGVQTLDIERLRDAFLESRSRLEHGTAGYYDQLSKIYDNAQLSINEPSDTGLQEQLADFWASWDDLAANPGDGAARASLVEQTKTLTNTFHRLDSDFSQMVANSITELNGRVSEINNYATQIAALNKAIQSASIGGDSPNDLMDQRDLLLRKLSDLAQVTTQSGDNNTVTVFVGGGTLVQGQDVRAIQVDRTGPSIVLRFDSDGNPNTTTDGPAASITTGIVGALMDGINTTIPGFRTNLDAVANSLVTAVNTVHAGGVDLDGNTGNDFFDAAGVTAASISIDSALDSNHNRIAARSATGGLLDGETARQLAEMASATTGPDVDYRTFINNIGIAAQQAGNRSSIQSSIRDSVDAAGQEVAGVNLDEEMANLVQYQHAYDAAAKMVSSVDEMIQSLIDMMR